MMRVGHVIHSLQPGGAEESLVSLSTVAHAAGFEMQVLSLMPLDTQRNAQLLLEQGVPIASLGLGSRWDPRALARGTSWCRKAGLDVIHTHLRHADVVGAVAAARLGIPMVSTLHLIDTPRSPVARLKRRAAALARDRVAAVTVAVSDAQREWYVREIGRNSDKVVTIHNGVPPAPAVAPAQREAIRATLGVAPHELVVLSVAVMRPGKGHEDILALARDMGTNRGVRFLLAGDGPLRKVLEEEAAAAGASAPVTFLGFRADVPTLLAASDLVIHPSREDALPTALIHALAAGRATVATRVGGIPEIVTPQSGVLVEVGDRSALVAEVTALLDDPERRDALGRAARRYYEREFELGRWAERLHATYARALGEPAT